MRILPLFRSLFCLGRLMVCNSIVDAQEPDDGFFDNLDPTADGFDDLTCHFLTGGLTDLDDMSTTSELIITGCDSGSGCVAGDPGFYESIAVDSVKIVKDC